MKPIPFLLVLLLLAPHTIAQRDLAVSQFHSNLQVVNPAAIGNDEVPRLSVAVRQDWRKLQHRVVDRAVTAELPVQFLSGAVGAVFTSERIGAHRTDMALFGYAYSRQVGTGKLHMGGAIGVMHHRFVGKEYILLPVVNEPLLNVGLHYRSDTYYMGASSTHVNQPGYNADNPHPFVRQYYANGGYFRSFGPSWRWETHGQLAAGSGYESAAVNMLARYRNRYWAGAGIAWHDTYMTFAGMVIPLGGSELRVSYSYEQSLGSVRKYRGGDHELQLAYRFNRGSKK